MIGHFPSHSFMIVCSPPEPSEITAVSISYEECDTVTNYIEVRNLHL